MALTRITKGVIKPNENYDTHNIHSTGIVTAIGLDINGNADVSGSLSVGGVLTYEDVTSIDSVGIITARTGLVSPYADIDDFIDVGSNIKLGNAGVITATSFVGDGSGLIGVASTDNIVTGTAATFTGGVDINSDLDVDGHTNLDNLSVVGFSTFTGKVAISTITTGGELADTHLYVKGGITFSEYTNSAEGNLPAVTQYSESGSQDLAIGTRSSGGDLLFFTGNVNSGTAAFGTNVNALRLRIDHTGKAFFTNDLDVDGHTNLDNVSITGVSTFADRVTISGGKDLFMFDNGVVRLGNNSNVSDFQMFHNGTHTYLNNATGSLYIANSSTGGSISLSAKSGQNGIIIKEAPVRLYYDNTLRFSTSGVGATVYGNLDVTADLDVDGHTNLDNVSIAGVTTITGSGTNLALNVSSGYARVAGGQPSVVAHKSSSTFIHMGVENNANARAFLAYTNGKNFIIGRRSAYTGDNTGYSAADITVNNENAVTLSYDGSTKFTTTNTGAVVTGIMTATSFSGDGSNLTGITGTTINSNTNNYLITGTGTANTLQGESNLIFDGATLKVGNNENPSNYNSGADNILIGNHSGHGGITILSGTTSGGYIMFSDNNGGGSNAYRGQIEYQHGGSDADHMRFITDSTEHLRISSEGQLKISGTDINSNTDMKHGYESGGGTSNSIYINRANSTFDWKGGLIMRGVGGTWGLRISAQGSMNTSSDTQGEIFGVHPVEPTNPTNAQSTYQDGVDDAYFRVMGNAKIFATVPIYQSGSRPFYFNSVAVTSNETITTSYNAMSVGNIQINSGNTVTVQSGARWVIV